MIPNRVPVQSHLSTELGSVSYESFGEMILTLHAVQNKIDEPVGLPESPDLAKFLLAAIVDSSDDAIISKDLNGIVTSWNKGACRAFGFNSDEMVGQSILCIIPPEQYPEEDAILARIRSGERIEHFETTRVKKNGEKIQISATISPVKDENGKIVGVSNIARDIGERTKADANRILLATIVDSADDAIISKDLNGIISSWNEGARRMFGYTAEEMIGQPLLRLIPKDLQYEEEEILRKLRAGEKIDHYETVRSNKTGDLIDVSVTISPLRNREGVVIGASKVARNITDRKRMEKALIQSEKLATTGRMAATIAHEINNPLEAVMNLIYLARNSRLEPEVTLGHLLAAEEELLRVSHITRQTLGFYREVGAPSQVYLHDLIEKVLAVYSSKLRTKSISVESCFNDLRKITVSHGEIVQVISNLVANAIDAMPAGGHLFVSVNKARGPNGDGYAVIVRDDGTGISQEHLGKVFEPFFTTKGNLGTGLGLWVAKQLIEQHGGLITVHSLTGPGKSGTTISVYLPFSRPTL